MMNKGRESVSVNQKSKVRVLIVNHTLSTLDPLLGHQVNIARAISREFTDIFVFTSGAPESYLGDLGYFLSSRHSKIRIVQGLGLLKDFLHVLRSFRPDLVFFHMTPKHCAIFSPVLKLLKIRMILWYAHKSTPASLLFSTKLVDAILTPSKGSISIENSKLKVTGHHIDFDFFYSKPALDLGQVAITVGRLDRSKRIKEVIESLAFDNSHGMVLECRLVGKPSSPDNLLYMISNYLLMDRLGLNYHVQEIVDKTELRSVILHSDVFLHASLGSLDKAPIEALIAGLPVASENKEFTDIFGTWSGVHPTKLSQELEAIYALSPENRVRLLVNRQHIAYELHSLSQWVIRFRIIADGLSYKSRKFWPPFRWEKISQERC